LLTAALYLARHLIRRIQARLSLCLSEGIPIPPGAALLQHNPFLAVIGGRTGRTLDLVLDGFVGEDPPR
jgi:hypothetical protein